MKNLGGLLLLFSVALTSLWLLLTLAKPMMEFADNCREQGGVVVQSKCLEVKELHP